MFSDLPDWKDAEIDKLKAENAKVREETIREVLALFTIDDVLNKIEMNGPGYIHELIASKFLPKESK